ncbi:MAG: hypothetical protein WBL15_13365 [Phycisphaerae bacterium]|jgi:hypothetical protein|nr:hypothetical protein [Phycisphaerae bacterium]HOJ56913.1 hypothetical protein [Phycisphaerae bacterium]HOL27109.1 hypothetical protein [Phycisphaerae bacterium]HPP21242.1 hypothetical protein [Phycisphaerae bacterium]HQE45466.1 hypothetical protein [Phycisphaerae bacterium]
MSQPQLWRWARSTVCTCSILLFLSTGITHGAVLLGVEDSSDGKLYEIVTGGGTVQMNHIATLGVPLATLEYNPSDGYYYGYTRTDAQAGAWSRLYRIDPGAGYAVTEIGQIKEGGIPAYLFEGAMAFASLGNGEVQAYGINLDGQGNNGVFTLNIQDGTLQSIARLNNGTTKTTHDINGAAWWNGKLVGIDQVTETIVAIDVTNGLTTSLFSLESLRENGASALGGIGGMTLIGDTAYFTAASSKAKPASSNKLYSINLNTGEIQTLGELSATVDSKGIGALAVPEPATLAFLCLGFLAMRSRHS